jgi:hypothetical protein
VQIVRRLAPAWNLLLLLLLLYTGAAERLQIRLVQFARAHELKGYFVIVVYLTILFALFATSSLAISRSSLSGTIEHGMLFICGASMMLMTQILAPARWLQAFATILLIAILATQWNHRLAALLSWLWIIIGIAASTYCIPERVFATPAYAAWLAVPMTLWIMLGNVIDRSPARTLLNAARWIPNVVPGAVSPGCV